MQHHHHRPTIRRAPAPYQPATRGETAAILFGVALAWAVILLAVAMLSQ